MFNVGLKIQNKACCQTFHIFCHMTGSETGTKTGCLGLVKHPIRMLTQLVFQNSVESNSQPVLQHYSQPILVPNATEIKVLSQASGRDTRYLQSQSVSVSEDWGDKLSKARKGLRLTQKHDFHPDWSFNLKSSISRHFHQVSFSASR